MTGAPIRVLLAIRVRMISDGIAACLAADDGLEVVATATDGRDALDLVRALKPQVVVLDASLAPVPRSEMAGELAAAASPRIVLLSAGWGALHELYEILPRVHGFVPLSEPARRLADTIRRVADGDVVVPEERPGVATILAPSGQLVRLGGKELHVLELLAHAYTNSEIAARLGISERTVNNHRTSVMRKLGVRHVVQLVRAALRAGVVNP